MVFAVPVVVNSTGVVPHAVQSAGNDVSRWLLVAPHRLHCMKTHLKEVASIGWKPLLLMVGETLFLTFLRWVS